VLGFTAAVALLVSLLFGVLPALRASRIDLVPALKNERRFVQTLGYRVPLRSAFLVAQVALSVVLLAGAGLLLRSLWNAYHVDPGFDPSHVAVVSVDLSRQGYAKERAKEAYARMLENVRALPGVRSAALARNVPIHRGGMITTIEIDGREPSPEDEANLNAVTPGFFATIGAPLLRGRDFEEADVEGRDCVVVNEAFARKFWPGEDALGKRIKNFGNNQAEVVGVVADFKIRSLREDAPPAVFVPSKQFYTPRMTFAVRTYGDPAAALPSIRSAIARVDPDLPMFDARPLEAQFGIALAQERIVAWLLVTFAGLALLLAATGFYGAFAYATRAREREFAIRVALGARALDLVATVVRSGVALATVGVALGLAAAYGLSGALASVVFGVGAADPASFAAAAVALVSLPALACYLPARRAARVDPATALREE
jgi:predicted permease